MSPGKYLAFMKEYIKLNLNLMVFLCSLYLKEKKKKPRMCCLKLHMLICCVEHAFFL